MWYFSVRQSSHLLEPFFKAGALSRNDHFISMLVTLLFRRFQICIRIPIRIDMYTYRHIGIYAISQICIRIPTYSYTYIPIYLYTYIPKCLNAYMPIYLYAYMPICLYAHTHTHTHTHTYTYTYI